MNAHFTWTEDGVRAHEREVTYTVSQFYNEEPLIEGIHVTRPRAKDKKLTRVLYDREQFWNEETYDEHYTNVVAPDRKSAKLMMPFEGSLTMTEGFTVEEVETSIPGEQPELYLTLLDGSTIAYQNPKGIAAQFIISADQKSITWAFDDDWCARLDLSHFSASTILEFSCRLTLDVRHAALPTILHPRVMINSLADPSLRDSGVYEIEKIQIMWGCLAKDTPIRMADGSEKQAQNIRPGDRVQSGDKMMDVRDVLTGREAELVCLYTQNGCMVRVTAQHPIGTARGFVPAGQLNAADSIQTSAGSSPVKYLYTELYNDQVYNFLLEQTGPLWCGGIAAGDFEMQNTLERPLRAKSAPDTALIAEMRGLFAQNK